MNLLARLKTFMASFLCLCLFHMQVAPVYAQDNVNVDSRQAREQQAAQASGDSNTGSSGASSNNANQDEMTSKTFSVKTEETDVGFSDMLVFILLIGVAAFILSIWKYEPMSLDMRVAMAAGLVMVVSVLVSIFNTRSKIDASTYRVEKKEDGTVNNMQLDALKEQRKAYVALKDHAALKWKIEAGATAAFLAAAYYAWNASKLLKKKSVACMNALETNACPVALSIHKKEIAERWAPAPSKIKTENKKANIKARKKAILQCEGVPPVGKTAAIAAVKGACLPEETHLLIYEPTNVQKYESHAFLKQNESHLFRGKKNSYKVTSLIDSLFIKNENLVEVSFLNRFIRTEDELSFIGSIPEKTHPILAQEHLQRGSDKSLSLEKVVGLFIPQAHGFQFDIKLFGLSAAALLIFKGIRAQLVSWMDKWIINPAHRRNLYLWASGITGLAAALSKMSMGQAEANIEKIDIMIKKMERLQDMSPAEQRLRQQDIGLAASLSPLEESPPVSIGPEGEALSCPRPLVEGKCPSLENEIRDSRGFGELDPQFAGIAGLAGGLADGVVGSNSLGAGDVESVEDLALTGAVAKRGLRKFAESVNKERQAKGQEPIDIDEQIKLGTRKFASIARKSLESSGSSPQKLLSGLGFQARPDKSEEEESVSLDEVLKQTSGESSKTGNFFEAPSHDSGFSFDFEDEEQNEETGVFQGDLDQYDKSVYAKAFDAQKTRGSEQIIGDRDVSIFRVISVRYMKSGLPKLLESLTEKPSTNGLE